MTNRLAKLILLFVLSITLIIGCSDDNNDKKNNYVGECIDIDGNVYETVTIGSQVWMAENLKTTHYRDGTPIPTGFSNSEWGNLDDTETGAYCEYDNNPANVATYGRLYNWYATTTASTMDVA